MFVQSPHAFTMTPQELLEISLVLKSTSSESMVRRSGSARSAQSAMQFNLIGKLTPRSVAPESIDATVVPFSPGKKKKKKIKKSVTYLKNNQLIIFIGKKKKIEN